MHGNRSLNRWHDEWKLHVSTCRRGQSSRWLLILCSSFLTPVAIILLASALVQG